jgi:hypothetical protein
MSTIPPLVVLDESYTQLVLKTARKWVPHVLRMLRSLNVGGFLQGIFSDPFQSVFLPVTIWTSISGQSHCHQLICIWKESINSDVNNTTNINKTDNQLSPQLREHKRDCDIWSCKSPRNCLQTCFWCN